MAWMMRLSRYGLRLVASLGFLAVAASACSSAGNSSNQTSSTGLASLEVISSDVTTQRGTDASPQSASSGDALAVGDTVATNEAGLAEVGFFDGSLTRVDHAARFTLVDLQDPDASKVVHTQLTAGRSWNRIEVLSESETWQTDTPVASATVRGTAFSTDCAIEVPDACRFAVVDGIVELALPDGTKLSVTAGQVVTVQKDTPPPTPTTVGLPLLMADPWIARNVAADVDDGKPELDETASAAPTDGQYLLTATAWSTDNCEGDGSYLDGETLTVAGSEAVVTVDGDMFGPSTIGPPDEYTGVSEVTFEGATPDPFMVAPTVLTMRLILTGGGVWGTNRLSASLHPNAFGCNETFTGRLRSDSAVSEPSTEHCDELIQKAPELVATDGGFNGGGGGNGLCVDGWGVGGGQDENGDESTIVFRWNGTAWEIVERYDLCTEGQLPPELYAPGCQTN
jgi:hypothetical protein